MELKIDENCIVYEPPLHDGFAEGLRVDRAKKLAILECSTVDGKPYTLSFEGIMRLEGSDFREGNIISTIFLFKGMSIPDEEIRNLFFGAHSKAKAENISKVTNDVKSSGLYFFRLWASYGLTLNVICKEISYR